MEFRMSSGYPNGSRRVRAAWAAVGRWHAAWMALREARYRHLAAILDPPEPEALPCKVVTCERAQRGQR